MDFNIKNTYIPINDKMASISHILSSTLDTETGTYPIASVAVFELVEIARLYTDIELPEDVVDAYDMLASEGVDSLILSTSAAIDVNRYKNFLHDQIKKFEFYQTSAYAILDSLKKDYNNLEFDVDEIKNKLSNSGEDLSFLKEVMDKLG